MPYVARANIRHGQGKDRVQIPAGSALPEDFPKGSLAELLACGSVTEIVVPPAAAPLNPPKGKE